MLGFATVDLSVRDDSLAVVCSLSRSIGRSLRASVRTTSAST
jgi:hypothetical protein